MLNDTFIYLQGYFVINYLTNIIYKKYIKWIPRKTRKKNIKSQKIFNVFFLFSQCDIWNHAIGRLNRALLSIHPQTFDDDTASGAWNMTSARQYCWDYLQGDPVVQGCLAVPNIDLDLEMEICTDDIMVSSQWTGFQHVLTTFSCCTQNWFALFTRN
jgi:hypothetical protein